MIRFLRRIFGKQHSLQKQQKEAIESVMQRYPNTLRDLARGEATEDRS